MNLSELVATLGNLDPVLVLDGAKDRVLYQNPVSLELFGSLARLDELLALEEDSGSGFSPVLTLKSLLRLGNGAGINTYLRRELAHGGNWILILHPVNELDAELVELCRGLDKDLYCGCLNRRAILYSLVREMARAQRGEEAFQLLLLSLSGFDALPAERLSRLLLEVADLVQATIRQTDILGRYDVGEFLLLLPATDHEGGTWVAQRTWRMLQAAPLQGLSVELLVGMSGLRNGDTPNDMIERARATRLNTLFRKSLTA